MGNILGVGITCAVVLRGDVIGLELLAVAGGK